MSENSEIFKKIDSIIKEVERHKAQGLDAELSSRNRKTARNLSEQEIFKTLSELIAFSQNANSERVSNVLKRGYFNHALHDFDIGKVAKSNPCVLIDKHWENIKGIRQQTKIFHIVMLARKLNAGIQISEVLQESRLPHGLKKPADIDAFWLGFKELKKKMQQQKIPFFRSTTSLLHMLMELGYDCVKPDAVVMKVAKDLGIVDDVNGDRNLLAVVKTIQKYSVDRGLRPPAADLYFLIGGGQAWARSFVDEEFYA